MVQDKLSLLVRNLRYETSPERVRKYFERFGEIRDVYLPLDYRTKLPRGFGFVEFFDDRDAEQALRTLHDGAEIDGSMISVTVAQQGRKSPDSMRQRQDAYSRGGGGRHRSRSRSPRGVRGGRSVERRGGGRHDDGWRDNGPSRRQYSGSRSPPREHGDRRHHYREEDSRRESRRDGDYSRGSRNEDRGHRETRGRERSDREERRGSQGGAGHRSEDRYGDDYRGAVNGYASRGAGAYDGSDKAVGGPAVTSDGDDMPRHRRSSSPVPGGSPMRREYCRSRSQSPLRRIEVSRNNCVDGDLNEDLHGGGLVGGLQHPRDI